MLLNSALKICEKNYGNYAAVHRVCSSLFSLALDRSYRSINCFLFVCEANFPFELKISCWEKLVVGGGGECGGKCVLVLQAIAPNCE